jgi:hypothetical protein
MEISEYRSVATYSLKPNGQKLIFVQGASWKIIGHGKWLIRPGILPEAKWPKITFVQ